MICDGSFCSYFCSSQGSNNPLFASTGGVFADITILSSNPEDNTDQVYSSSGNPGCDSSALALQCAFGFCEGLPSTGTGDVWGIESLSVSPKLIKLGDVTNTINVSVTVRNYSQDTISSGSQFEVSIVDAETNQNIQGSPFNQTINEEIPAGGTAVKEWGFPVTAASFEERKGYFLRIELDDQAPGITETDLYLPNNFAQTNFTVVEEVEEVAVPENNILFVIAIAFIVIGIIYFERKKKEE